MAETRSKDRKATVAELLKRHGQELLKYMAFRKKARKEWGVNLAGPLSMTPDAMLDYIVAQSVDMMFYDVTENGVETLYMEQDSDTRKGVVYAVPFRPSRNLEDATWASRIAGHGFDNDATDPLVVCASVLGRI